MQNILQSVLAMHSKCTRTRLLEVTLARIIREEELAISMYYGIMVYDAMIQS